MGVNLPELVFNSIQLTQRASSQAPTKIPAFLMKKKHSNNE
jgi:hypothetical protein